MIEVKARAARPSPIPATKSCARVSPAFLALVPGSIGASQSYRARVSICAAVRALVFMVVILQALVMWAEWPRGVTA